MGRFDNAGLGWGQMVALVREDWEQHQRDWTQPGFRALAVYRFGLWQRSIQGTTLRVKLLRKATRFVYRFVHRYVRNHYGIELHRSATIGRRLRIAHQGTIVIHLTAQIGDDCLIRHGVTIGAASNFKEEDAPRLGDRVNVGAGAMILGSITIGDDVRIGPNAVVLMDVPPNSTVFAPPARIIEAPPDDRHSGTAPERTSAPGPGLFGNE